MCPSRVTENVGSPDKISAPLNNETDFICDATKGTRVIRRRESGKSEVLVCSITDGFVKVCDVVCRVRVLSAAPFLPRLAKNLFAVAESAAMPRYRRFKCSVVYKVIKSCGSWLGLHFSILYFSHTKI